VKEALNHSNGWVYEIDEACNIVDIVPPEAITGAWQVNEDEIMIGYFIPNAQYKPKE
jgi:hypothetical protein